jgi:hypothetical protein
MSIPSKDKPLLTVTEKERLVDPKLDSKTRKRNNLIVKRKIQSWLNDADSVLYALKHLTETQLERTVTDKEIYALFSVTEILLDKLNFATIKGQPEHPYVSWFVLPPAGGEVKVAYRRAKESDFERNWRVQEHVKVLQRSYPSNPEEESPAYKKYREDREYQEIVEACKKHGMRVPAREDIIHEKLTIRGAGPLYYIPGEKNTLKGDKDAPESKKDEPK